MSACISGRVPFQRGGVHATDDSQRCQLTAVAATAVCAKGLRAPLTLLSLAVLPWSLKHSALGWWLRLC